MPVQHDPAERRPRPITVALVDDEQMIRSAVGQALSNGGLELVGEATSLKAAVKLVVDQRPDVVLMDLRLPGSSGVRTIQKLSLLAPVSRILILTRSEENQVVEAIIAGASGYILKSARPRAILTAIRQTAAGEAVISPQVAGKLLTRIRDLGQPVSDASLDTASAIRAALTTRELDIFTQLASGKSDLEIAAELSLSPSTVSNHINSILPKLHLHNRIQAAVQAVRSGIS